MPVIGSRCSAHYYLLQRVLPADGMRGGHDPLRRDQDAVALAGQIRQCGEVRNRNAVLLVRHVVANDDGVRAGR